MNSSKGQYPPPAFKWILGLTVVYGMVGLLLAGFHFVLSGSGLKVYPKATAGFVSTFVDARGYTMTQMAQLHPQVTRAISARGHESIFEQRSRAPTPREGAGSFHSAGTDSDGGQPPIMSTQTAGEDVRIPPPSSSGFTSQPPQEPPSDVIRALRSQGILLTDDQLTSQALDIILSVDPSNPVSVGRAAAELKLLSITEGGRQGLRILEDLENNPDAVERSRRILEQGTREVGDLIRRIGGGGG